MIHFNNKPNLISFEMQNHDFTFNTDITFFKNLLNKKH